MDEAYSASKPSAPLAPDCTVHTDLMYGRVDSMVRPALSELRDINITYTPCAGPMTPSSDDRTSAVYAYCNVAPTWLRLHHAWVLGIASSELNATHP
jgi:hypothetical protein